MSFIFPEWRSNLRKFRSFKSTHNFCPNPIFSLKQNFCSFKTMDLAFLPKQLTLCTKNIIVSIKIRHVIKCNNYTRTTVYLCTLHSISGRNGNVCYSQLKLSFSKVFLAKGLSRVKYFFAQRFSLQA